MPKPVVPDRRMAYPSPRRYIIIGKHSAQCRRWEHPDYAHDFTHCAADDCDCTAHYIVDRDSTSFGE